MTRFEPDTLRDALMRPLAMAAPNGGVYVEFLAPDFRFLFILALLVALLVLVRRRRGAATPPMVLLALCAAAFLPWLATTGNGRYFMAFLLLAGPLCIGLVQLLPVTRAMRFALALGMVAWQGYLLHDVAPWGSWTYVQWGDGPAFQIEVPPDMAEQPATYVGLATISYSLIAPRFHPDSRWINISAAPGLGHPTADQLRTEAFLRTGNPLRVIFPSPPGAREGDVVDAPLETAIDDLLARQGLSISNAGQCRFLRSRGLDAAARQGRQEEGRQNTALGFWVCPLQRHARSGPSTTQPLPPYVDAVFQKMERTCPGLFNPGAATTLRIPAGGVRGYPASDFKLYVLTESGQVMYKYLRALNPVVVGTVHDVLDPAFHMDCSKVQGRTGLPWEREI
jgi:hypothetical protein